PTTTWGTPRDLSTWSGPAVADVAWQARAAELAVVAAAADGRAGHAAARELLALQASDWAFLLTRELAGAYPRERAAGHARRLRALLDGDGDPGALRNLAPDADPRALRVP